MALGAFAPLPLRLGGSDIEGLTSQQHARICADWMALRRVQPLAQWTYDKSGASITIHNYRGQNGTGAAFAPIATNRGTGITSFDWTTGLTFTDDYGIAAPFLVSMPIVTANSSSAIKCTAAAPVGTVTLFVYTWNTAGAAVDASVNVTLW